MIVSHSRRIVILGNRKCGTTTLQRYLGHLNEMPKESFEFADPNARSNAIGFEGQEFSPDLQRLLSNTRIRHWTGYQLERLFAELDFDWSAYRKVVTIRNPWDRMVSNFMWSLKSRAPAETDQSAITFTDPSDMQQFLFGDRRTYSDPVHYFTGVLDGDWQGHGFDVIRLEDFPEKLPLLWKAMTDDPMPDRVGFYNRTEHPAYVDCYTDIARQWVERLFASDIAAGDYEFGMTGAKASMRSWMLDNLA